MLRRKALSLVCAGAALLFGGAAHAERPHAYRHAEAGDFDYYVLVLGWSPSYCLSEGDERGDGQCDTARAHDFVLHGLWPQYDSGWPEDCYRGQRPWVPNDVIAEMQDIMPNKGLIVHEYKTHGTCSGLSPEAYYDDARALFEKVDVPDMFEDPQTQSFLSPEKVERAFMAANDWLRPDMIAVTCRRGNLFDVRICFGRDLAPQDCGANIDQRRLCPLRRITVPVPQKR